MGLMGLGVFSAGTSVFLTYAFGMLLRNGRDHFLTVGELYIWMAVELWVILIAGSLPATWPLVNWGYAKLGAETRSRTIWPRRRSRQDSLDPLQRSKQTTSEADGEPVQNLRSPLGTSEPVTDTIQLRKGISVEQAHRNEFGDGVGLASFDDSLTPPAVAHA